MSKDTFMSEHKEPLLNPRVNSLCKYNTRAAFDLFQYKSESPSSSVRVVDPTVPHHAVNISHLHSFKEQGNPFWASSAAEQDNAFSWWVFCREFLYHMMYPFSMPVILLAEGQQGLILRHFVHVGGDSWQTNISGRPPLYFVLVQVTSRSMQWAIVALAILVYYTHGTLGASLHSLALASVTIMTPHAIVALKWAKRGRDAMSKLRLMAPADRRDEEIIYGWIPLSDKLIRYLMEVESSRLGIWPGANMLVGVKTTNRRDPRALICSVFGEDCMRYHDSLILTDDAAPVDSTFIGRGEGSQVDPSVYVAVLPLSCIIEKVIKEGRDETIDAVSPSGFSYKIVTSFGAAFALLPFFHLFFAPQKDSDMLGLEHDPMILALMILCGLFIYLGTQWIFGTWCVALYQSLYRKKLWLDKYAHFIRKNGEPLLVEEENGSVEAEVRVLITSANLRTWARGRCILQMLGADYMHRLYMGMGLYFLLFAVQWIYAVSFLLSTKMSAESFLSNFGVWCVLLVLPYGGPYIAALCQIGQSINDLFDDHLEQLNWIGLVEDQSGLLSKQDREWRKKHYWHITTCKDRDMHSRSIVAENIKIWKDLVPLEVLGFKLDNEFLMRFASALFFETAVFIHELSKVVE